MRKLIIGAAIALLVSSGAMAQTSTVLRKPDGSGPIPADNSGLKVQGAGVAGAPAGGVQSIQGVASGTPVRVDCVTGCSGGGGGGGRVASGVGYASGGGGLYGGGSGGGGVTIAIVPAVGAAAPGPGDHLHHGSRRR